MNYIGKILDSIKILLRLQRKKSSLKQEENWLSQEKKIRKKVQKLYKEQTSRIPNPFEEEEERLKSLNKHLLFAKKVLPRIHDSRDFLLEEEIEGEETISREFPPLFTRTIKKIKKEEKEE